MTPPVGPAGLELADLPLALLDLVLPRTCAGCRAPGRGLCRACAAELAGHPHVTRPRPCPPGLPLLTAAAPYDGVVRAVLLAHKEHGRTGLARPLGAALAGAVALLRPPAGLVLVPVPSARAVVRERGHDHALRLARAAARRPACARRRCWRTSAGSPTRPGSTPPAAPPTSPARSARAGRWTGCASSWSTTS
jgi:predicted amidophosphoribosyltransferase